MAICKGEDGFDLRLGNKGSWGIALYFSESVSYADRFAHITSEGDREILVASVLVGEAYDFGTVHSKDLRMPPVRETSKENLNHTFAALKAEENYANIKSGMSEVIDTIRVNY